MQLFPVEDIVSQVVAGLILAGILTVLSISGFILRIQIRKYNRMLRKEGYDLARAEANAQWASEREKLEQQYQQDLERTTAEAFHRGCRLTEDRLRLPEGEEKALAEYRQQRASTIAVAEAWAKGNRPGSGPIIRGGPGPIVSKDIVKGRL